MILLVFQNCSEPLPSGVTNKNTFSGSTTGSDFQTVVSDLNFKTSNIMRKIKTYAL